MVVFVPIVAAFVPFIHVRHDTQRFVPPRTRTCPIRAAATTSASDQIKSDLDAFVSLVKQSQQSLCAEIEIIDGAEQFSNDPWKSKSGEGITKGK